MELAGLGRLNWNRFFPRTQRVPDVTTGDSVWRRRALRQGWRELLTLWYIAASADRPDYPGYEL